MQNAYVKNKPYCIEERAKKFYGTTEYFELAGYLLENGEMLNLSHEGYQRDQDHRNIGFFFEKASGTDAMVKFMNRGNIRVSCHNTDYCFELSKKPTQLQTHQIKRAYYEAIRNAKGFYLEYKNKQIDINMLDTITLPYALYKFLPYDDLLAF